MTDEYGSHADYIEWVRVDADSRQQTIEDALRRAFSNFTESCEVEVIVFSSMTAFDLAEAIAKSLVILKPLLAICSIAARAIERDLSIKNLDTYSPRLSEDQAKVIAGYIKPFLPPYLEIPTLSQIDRIAFVDKEIRARKGRWEKSVLESLDRFSNLGFHKRAFAVDDEQFELDAASPKSGNIEIGIDIKRIEARRDIHKRCDEIVNKASKLKSAFPKARFAAVIYYPFIEEHVNVQHRLRSEAIDSVVFASQSRESVDSAVRMLLSALGVSKK
jgi:hypothetical protein